MHDWLHGGRNNHCITAAAHLAAAQKNITRADLDATFGLETAPVMGRILRSKTIIGIRRSSWIRHFSLKKE